MLKSEVTLSKSLHEMPPRWAKLDSKGAFEIIPPKSNS